MRIDRSRYDLDEGWVSRAVCGVTHKPVGRRPTPLVIRAAHGDYLTDLEKLDWRKSTAAEVSWSAPLALPPELGEKLMRAYRSGGLLLERVIRDLHSGRIVGQWGVYVVDGAALLFMALVISRGCG